METQTFSQRWSPQAVRLLFAGLMVALAGMFTLTAFAQPAARHDGGMFMGTMGGRGLDRMLDSVKATDAQRAQVKQITQAAAADLKAERESTRALHEQSMNLFTQASVDADAAEALRQKMLVHHDRVSKRMLQAMLDISRVLTPEQRKQLAEHMKHRRGMMQRHMHEPPPPESK